MLDSGDYDQAIAAYTEAIELDPSVAVAYENRAEAYKRLGREKEAQADLERLERLKLVPDQRVSSTPFLKHLGVDTYMEKGSKTYQAQWFINISEGPIRQAVIESSVHAYSDPDYYEDYVWRIWYRVPLIGRCLPKVFSQFDLSQVLRSVRVRKFPIFGKDFEVRWETSKSMPEGDAIISELVARLSQDSMVRKSIVEGVDVAVHTDHSRGCWVFDGGPGSDSITPASTTGIFEELAPTREQWDCYQAIARHLLATPIPTKDCYVQLKRLRKAT